METPQGSALEAVRALRPSEAVTIDPPPEVEEAGEAPTRDLQTFWTRLDAVFRKLQSEPPLNDALQEILDQLPSSAPAQLKDYRSALFQPERVSLSSQDDILPANSYSFFYNQFRIRLPKALRGIKSAQIIRATVPSATIQIPDTACVFWYYKLPMNPPNPPPALSKAYLRYVRLLPSYIPPELIAGGDYGQNRTFQDYQDLANELGLSCLDDPLAGIDIGDGIEMTAGDIEIIYNPQYNKFQLVGSDPDFAYLPASYNDLNVQDGAEYLKIASENPFGLQGSGDSVTSYLPGVRTSAINEGQPYWPGQTLNLRLGFTWNGFVGDTADYYNLMREVPAYPNAGVVLQNSLTHTANSYANLNYSSCCYVYADFVQGSTQDSAGNGGLLCVVPMNAPNTGIGFYQATISTPLTKIPDVLTEIGITLLTDTGEPFFLPDSAVVNLELQFQY